MGPRDFFYCELSETIPSVHAFFTLVVLTPQTRRAAWIGVGSSYIPSRVSSICG
jgi:hypothetical protein